METLTDAGTERQPALDNPYLDAVLERTEAGVGGGRPRPTDVDHDDRDELVDRYAWAIPNAAAVSTIAEHGPILEVGAGDGYWAMLLLQEGVDVVATDPAAPFESQWAPVRSMTAQEAVGDYPDRTLLMVWPTEDATWPVETLASFEGDTLVYVGEGPGGCTADKHFHHLLMDHWERERRVDIPQYRGVSDRLEVWTRGTRSMPSLSLQGIRSLALSPDG